VFALRFYELKNKNNLKCNNDLNSKVLKYYNRKTTTVTAYSEALQNEIEKE